LPDASLVCVERKNHPAEDLIMHDVAGERPFGRMEHWRRLLLSVLLAVPIGAVTHSVAADTDAGKSKAEA
jgi:hypothetical protein